MSNGMAGRSVCLTFKGSDNSFETIVPSSDHRDKVSWIKDGLSSKREGRNQEVDRELRDVRR